jgi:hypothetical protein
MKITKSLLREYIKEEISLLKEAEYTIPDEDGLEAEFSKLRRVRKIASKMDMNFEGDSKQKALLRQVQEAGIEYKEQVREIQAVASELDNWRRLLKNTQDLFYFMRSGGSRKGLELPKFAEMSDRPLGEEE